MIVSSQFSSSSVGNEAARVFAFEDKCSQTEWIGQRETADRNLYMTEDVVAMVIVAIKPTASLSIKKNVELIEYFIRPKQKNAILLLSIVKLF